MVWKDKEKEPLTEKQKGFLSRLLSNQGIPVAQSSPKDNESLHKNPGYTYQSNRKSLSSGDGRSFLNGMALRHEFIRDEHFAESGGKPEPQSDPYLHGEEPDREKTMRDQVARALAEAPHAAVRTSRDMMGLPQPDDNILDRGILAMGHLKSAADAASFVPRIIQGTSLWQADDAIRRYAPEGTSNAYQAAIDYNKEQFPVSGQVAEFAGAIAPYNLIDKGAQTALKMHPVVADMVSSGITTAIGSEGALPDDATKEARIAATGMGLLAGASAGPVLHTIKGAAGFAGNKWQSARFSGRYAGSPTLGVAGPINNVPILETGKKDFIAVIGETESGYFKYVDNFFQKNFDADLNHILNDLDASDLNIGNIEVVGNRHGVEVSVAFFDEAGEVVGRRNIDFYPPTATRSRPRVYGALFMIDDAVRGNRVAGQASPAQQINGAFFRTLAKSSNPPVYEISAGLTHGGYAWPAQGFLPKYPSSTANMLKSRLIDKAEMKGTKEAFFGDLSSDDLREMERIIEGIKTNPKKIWRLAEFKGTNGKPYGKELLKGSSYNAYFDPADAAQAAQFKHRTGIDIHAE